MMVAHFHKNTATPFRIQLDGGGGTGKTYLITMISAHLEKLAEKRSRIKSPTIRTAPTGTAANLIRASTLHSLFRLPVQAKEIEPLSATALKNPAGTF
jgi:hypothetical protein